MGFVCVPTLLRGRACEPGSCSPGLRSDQVTTGDILPFSIDSETTMKKELEEYLLSSGGWKGPCASASLSATSSRSAMGCPENCAFPHRCHSCLNAASEKLQEGTRAAPAGSQMTSVLWVPARVYHRLAHPNPIGCLRVHLSQFQQALYSCSGQSLHLPGSSPHSSDPTLTHKLMHLPSGIHDQSSINPVLS